MDRHIELLRRHIKDQAAEVEQLAVTWEQQKESDQGKIENTMLVLLRTPLKFDH